MPDCGLLSSFAGEMILTRSGDLNLNQFPQATGESAMEGLKQAMLEHELIFKNQVRELHRLYWNQRNLMNELRNGFSATAERKQSADEKNAALSKFYRPREVGASLDWNVASLLNHQRNFNLHLLADDLTGDPADLPANNLSQIEASMSNGGNGTLGNLRLGSAIGDGILKKNMRPPNFLCKEIIDLEESVDLKCNEVENEAFCPEFKASTPISSGLFGSKVAILCDKASLSVFCNKKKLVPSMVHIIEAYATRLKEKEPPASSCVPVESRVAASSSYHASRPMLIDLNAPHDECYHKPNEPVGNIILPCLDSSLFDHGVNGLEPNKSCPDGTSFVSELGSAKPAEVSSCEKRAENWVDMNITGLSDKAHISSLDKQDSNITSSYSVNLPQNVMRDSTDKQRYHKGSEEDTLSNQENTQLRKHSVGYSTDDSVTTQLNSPKTEISSIANRKTEEEQETSVAIAAAEALVSISLGSIELVECDDKSKEPQNSSDSFELMTLCLPEVRNRDLLEMPPLPSMNETGKEDSGIQLRRGRRLRDFRKEILPGLMPLSRHEITEDMHNIGYKLRKRTLTSAGESWFLPVRRRRSRLYLDGRR